MDFIKKALDGENRAADKQVSESTNSNQEHHGFNLGDTINGALGGGKKSEENEGELTLVLGGYPLQYSPELDACFSRLLCLTSLVADTDMLDKA